MPYTQRVDVHAVSETEEGRQAGADLFQCLGRATAGSFRAAGFPVDALYVVGQDYSGDTASGGNRHFERIAFDPVRDRRNQRQTGLRVVYSRTQYERWAATRVLAACLWVEDRPCEGAGLRDAGRAYQDSFPCGCPQCVSL